MRNLSTRATRSALGYTITEMMIVSALGAILGSIVMGLTVFGARSFAALGNYTELNASSRNALDVLSREIREATQLTSFVTNRTGKSLTFTNGIEGYNFAIVHDPVARRLIFRKTGETDKTLLTECDGWDYFLYTRAPNPTTNQISFNTSALLSHCKLIKMSWSCSRSMLRRSAHTEDVNTALIVMRNKVK